MAVVPGEVDLAPECSFCSKDRDHVEGMIVGEEARIFDKCLHLCLENPGRGGRPGLGHR